MESNAAVGVHLADQLLLPMALAGKGKFTTLAPSLHTQINIDVIKQFFSCSIDMGAQENLLTVTINKEQK